MRSRRNMQRKENGNVGCFYRCKNCWKFLEFYAPPGNTWTAVRHQTHTNGIVHLWTSNELRILCEVNLEHEEVEW